MAISEQYGSSTEISRETGVPVRTIESWAKKGLISQDEQRRYPLLATYRARLQALDQQLKKTTSQGTVQQIQDASLRQLLADARLKEAQADIKELDRDERRGMLIEAAAVAFEWKNYILRCRARVLTLPTKLADQLAQQLEPKLCQDLLQRELDDALNELGTVAENDPASS